MFNEYIKGDRSLHQVLHTSQHCDLLAKTPNCQLRGTYADAHQEAHHVGLLLLLKFLDIFEGTHLGWSWGVLSTVGLVSRLKVRGSALLAKSVWAAD
jgi:hypothetical protein